MPLYRDDRETILGATSETPRHEMWKDVKASWLEIAVIVPGLKAFFTAIAFAIAFTVYRLNHLQPDVDPVIVGFDTLIQTLVYSFFFFWLLFAGVLRHVFNFIIYAIERMFRIDINRDNQLGAPQKLLISPYMGQANANRVSKSRERQRMEEFIRFVGQSQENSTIRVLDKKYGNAWAKWKAELASGGWIEYDNKNQPNSRWHLIEDADTVVLGVFAAEDKAEAAEQLRQSNKPDLSIIRGYRKP